MAVDAPARPFAALVVAADLLARSRGHVMRKPLRDGSLTLTAECHRCGWWYLVAVTGTDDPITGRAVRRTCPMAV